MAQSFVVTVTGLDALRADLNRLVQRLDKPADLMADLAGVLRTQVEQRFDTKTDPNGARWQPLADSTRARYAKADKARSQGSLLQRSNDMRGSLTPGSGPDWAEVGMSRLTTGGRWQVPALHEFGTSRMPRRGIFFADPQAGTLGQADQDALADEIDRWLKAQFPG